MTFPWRHSVNVPSYFQPPLCTETALFIFPFLSPLLHFVLSLNCHSFPFVFLWLIWFDITSAHLHFVVAVPFLQKSLSVYCPVPLHSTARVTFQQNNRKMCAPALPIRFYYFFNFGFFTRFVHSLLFFLYSFVIFHHSHKVPTVRHWQGFASLSSL